MRRGHQAAHGGRVKRPPPSAKSIQAIADASLHLALLAQAVYRGTSDDLETLEAAVVEFEDALAAVNPMVAMLSGTQPKPIRKARPRLAK